MATSTMPQPGQPTCRHCGRLLDRLPASTGGLCADSGCTAKQLAEAGRRISERDRQQRIDGLISIVESYAASIDAAASDLGGPDQFVCGIVPRQDRLLVPLPEVRYAAFASRVHELVAEAFREDPPSVDVTRAEEGAVNSLMAAACATCEGQCCAYGAASHAFLTAELMQLLRRRHPEMSEPEVAAHYLDRLPLVSVADSCVFHGKDGCALPREERSDVCNSYQCTPLRQLEARSHDAAARKTLIFACEPGTAPALAMYEDGQVQRLALGEPDRSAPLTTSGDGSSMSLPSERLVAAAQELPAPTSRSPRG